MTDMSRLEKEDKLKGIIKQLHDGVPVDKLKKDFSSLIKNTSPEEIADMENALIQEGFPPEEIQRLCDVHVQVFEQSLKKVGKTSKIPGHPVFTFVAENKEAKRILKNLKKNAKKLTRPQPKENEIQSFIKYFKLITEIEKHYQRKENQLFPILEEKQFTGPTKVMWGKHDEIRDMIRGIKKTIEKQSWLEIFRQVKTLSSAIKRLIFLEEKILYPTSGRKLNENDWAKIKMGEPEIGYAWVTPSNLWDASLAKFGSGTGQKPIGQSQIPKQDSRIPLSKGNLNGEQVNLMLKNLPVDITFVNENDEVCYYSDTKDRVFPRSPAIIGRKIQNCHPPKSIGIVNEILKSFREKKKDVAEFWIQMDGKFIYIRYFPVYDDNGNYRGVIEVSQDVTGIKKLEGERRLLDW